MSDRMIAIISLLISLLSITLNIYQARKDNRYKREALLGQKITNNNDALYKIQKLSQLSPVVKKLDDIETAVIEIFKLIKDSSSTSRK